MFWWPGPGSPRRGWTWILLSVGLCYYDIMKIRLFAFDLDGTLVDRAGGISAENLRAVAQARASGAEVIIVTGRSWRSTLPYYRALQMTGPAICYLGALVVADGTGRVTDHLPLAPEAWNPLRRLALAEGLSITAAFAVPGDRPGRVHGPGDETAFRSAEQSCASDVAYATGRAEDFRGWADWNPYTEIDPSLERCIAQPTMAAVYGDWSVGRVMAAFPHGLPRAQFDLSDRVQGETVLHVWHESVDKGSALARYCRQRSIPPDAVMALGDAAMDVSMLRFAGIGVAVPGSHPAAIAAADWVASPAEAVARALGSRG